MKSFVRFFEKCDLKRLCSFFARYYDGGLAIALAECCILSAKGVTIELDKYLDREDHLLFAEGGSRIIFSIEKEKEKSGLLI